MREEQMKIGIIGGGSIGLLFAYYLNQIFPVTVYTRTKEQSDKINKEGIWLKKKEQIYHTIIDSTTIDCWQGNEELTLVTVKQYQLDSVLNQITKKTGGTGRLLFLQNGMGHLKFLNSLLDRDVYVGTIEHGAYRDSGNVVFHNGEGVTRAAVFKGDADFLKNFAKAVPETFPFVLNEDYYEMLLQKLIVNAVINPLTAAFHVPNGELIHNPYYYQIMQEVFNELADILKLKQKDVSFNHVKQVCKQTSQNRSSMLKDIETGRETEVEAILGFLLEEAEKKEINAPVIRTFYHIIKGKEYKRGDNLNV